VQILLHELEAQIDAFGADVEKNVARRRDRVMLAANLTKRMQVLRAWHSKQPIPSIGTERHDARKAAFEVAKTNRA
jgi:hypothetical protein